MSDIPPAGTPVDQRLYNEACQRISDLEVRLQSIEAILDALPFNLSIEKGDNILVEIYKICRF